MPLARLYKSQALLVSAQCDDSHDPNCQRLLGGSKIDPDVNMTSIIDQYDKKEIREPVVTTVKIDSISNASVKLTGAVPDDGGSPIIERGFWWGIHVNPDETDNTSSVSLNGDFITIINGLESNYNYYFRAYAKNKEKTGYGEVLMYHTSSLPPVVKINSPEGGDSFQKGEIVKIDAK